MSGWRRRARRLRRALTLVLAGALILAGLGVALLSQLLPALQSRPDEVAAYMQRQLGVPVALDAAEAEWTGSGVRLRLSGLRIGGIEGPRVPDAVLWLRPFSGWLPGRTLSTLQISGPELVVERSDAGPWRVQGLGLATQQPLDLQVLERLGEVVLDQASLRVLSAADGLDLQLSRVDGRLRPEGGRLALALQVFVDASPPLQLQLRATPDLLEGSAHLGLRRAPLGDWMQRALDSAWQIPASLGSGDAWLDWEHGRITAMQFSADLSAQPGPTVPGGEPVARALGAVVPERPPLSIEGLWKPGPGGGEWQVREAGRSGGAGWLRLSLDQAGRRLQAADWQLGTWWPWLSASLPLSEAQRTRLQAVAADGRLGGLRVDWPGDGQPSYWLTLEALHSLPFARIPGIAGLSLSVQGVGERAEIGLDARPLEFDWRSSLADLMQPALSGRVMLWRDEIEGWCAHAMELSLAEPDYAIEAEGGVCFDGGAPQADLRVAVGGAPIVTANRFWLLDRMPEPAVNWLTEALQGGRLDSGTLILHGDLDDWPFAGGEGRMEAIAVLDALNLKFRPDWPQGEALSGVARFVNDSLEVEGRARLAGIEVSQVSGRIPRYRDSRLLLALGARADAADYLALLRSSPLWPTLEPGLGQVEAHGPARAEVRLDIPLKRELGAPKVDGEVLLEEADLRHRDWGIAFDGARGSLRFSERGVLAEALDVLHAGRPASFLLRIGSFVEDPAQRVEAGLLGRLDAGALIDTQPDLDWLKPALDGVSNWDIGLQIPLDPALRPRLSLDSDLVGTALRLPAPLRKSAATRLPLALEIELGESTKGIRLGLGELLRASGTLQPGAPFNGVALFGETASVERPARGLRVRGQVPVLDAGGWMDMAGDGGELLESIELASGELDLFGRGFGETLLRYRREGEARRIGFEGQRLNGEIEIPGGLQWIQRGITARFARVHLPAASRGEDSTAGSSLDPSSLPPLHVLIADLRLGDALLGESRLETYPQPGAMHVEQFSARSDALSLSARGDWRSEPGGTRSRFSVEFTAQSLGAMLAALGFSELVEGGQTLATLEGDWPGPPTAFSLASVSGELTVSVGSGRIPQVDPGAGRLFGLFSLNEIPRRLALDFTDFFRSGLAFNQIEGSFLLENGSAWTDQLLIDSPAAEIRLRGRTSLRAQEYAQTMEVLPRAGNVLPVVGALAAGPAGAAIGAVAQAVLQKPFKQITRTLYSVNGSWDKPAIDVIERGPAKPLPAGEQGVPGP